MAKTTRGRGKSKKGGRRANYAPAKTRSGIWEHLPITWVNWLGFALFGFLAVALLAQFIANLMDLDRYGNDWIASGVMTVVFVGMTYLFATTRAKE